MTTRYTGFIRWPDGGVEEIDVDADNRRQARVLIQKQIDSTRYLPGGKIFKILARFGWYL